MMEIQEGVALAPFTTFGIGGKARYFARVQNMIELYEALEFAEKEHQKFFILGGGSNILVDDAGFDGLVIKIELKGIELLREEEGVLLVAAAGEGWEGVVGRAVDENIWGLENLAGIPGTVGGAVVQNIGAYGAALSQTLEWVEVYDSEKKITKTFTNEKCEFGYRESIFKKEVGRYVVLNVAFRLSPMPRPDLSYKDLAIRFKDTTPSLRELHDAVIEIRKNKFPDLAIEGTAGSFFKNPVLPLAEAQKLQEKYPEMPVFTLPESTDIKIPLGWLLDYRHNVLDMRELKVGGARMYEKQFLVIAAEKNTSSSDIKMLAREVQKKLFDVCGISVEPEVYFVE